MNETWTNTLSYACRGSVPGGRPGARCTHGMAFSAKDARVMLLGGANLGTTSTVDLWLYDAKTKQWTQRQSAGYLGGGYCGMVPVYDEVTDFFYVFDYNADQMYKYSIASNQWTSTGSANAPKSNWSHVMAVSESRRVIVLYTSETPYETWVYNIPQNSWTRLTYNTAADPGPRYRSGMDYDVVNDVFILMAGKNSPDDLWELKLDPGNASGTWRDITSLTTDFPSTWTTEHRMEALRYDRKNNVFWIDGGWRGVNAFRYGKGGTGNASSVLKTAGGPAIHCYPSPFRSRVDIHVTLSKALSIPPRFAVYNLEGRKMADLSMVLSGSRISASWDASHCPSGIYMVKLDAGGLEIHKKIVLRR